MSRRAIALLLCAVLAGLAGCAGKSPAGDRISGRTMTIYSSMPLHGAARAGAQAVVNGEALALAQIHGRIGPYQIALKSLDDSTVARDGWDPGQATQNARLAIADRTAIGYLGELESGASAISLPLLNRARIPQISPASTAVGLTSSADGASPGEPQKYYPTGVRTFARVIPNDEVQAVAQVRLQQRLGCARTEVLDDGEVDGQDAATSFSLAARVAGLRVTGVQAFDPTASDYSSLTAAAARSGADCVLISAVTGPGAVLLTRQIAAALPAAKIFGSAGLAQNAYTNPAQGGLPAALDRRVWITFATLDAGARPAGRAPDAVAPGAYGSPAPYASYGYEAMSLLLDAIDRATDHGRKAPRRSQVLAAIFDTHDRRSVLGTYSIDRHGDTTLRRYGVYRVHAGRLSFWWAIDA